MPSLKNTWKLLFISAVIGAITILPCVSTQASASRTSKEGTIKVRSQILNEERSLSVALPQDYDKNQKAYPVLYILDAEAGNEFTESISTVKDLHAKGIGPQMILIGIWNTNRNRDMIPAAVPHRPGSGGSQKFLKFITDEVEPYVKQNYRTTDFSVLYGASNAGLFSVYALLENPDAFDGIIASSPMIGHCPDFMQMKADAFVRRDQVKDCALYMICGTEDSHRVTEYVPDFQEFLKSKAPQGFFSKFKILKGEGHVPKSSKSRGLRYVFAQHKSRSTLDLAEKENGNGKSLRSQNPAEKPGTWEWSLSTPEKQQLDPEPLAELVSLIREGQRYPRLRSLLVIRHGYLVVEEYFGGYQGDRPHTLQSVSKSFTSALIGIAISRGEFKGVNERILDFFPNMKGIDNLDKRKESIRLQDLLTMRSGTDYNENGPDSPHFQLNRQPRGWDKFYLDRPMLRDPGTHFLYDSGGVILMSAMLKNRSGMHADQYAEKYLFKPLQIAQKLWFRNQEGHPHTGGGLSLKPRDTAKFGLLYLHKGRWGSEQIVPEAWVKESFIKRVDFGTTSQRTIGYGYLWWILRPDPDGNGKDYIYAAMGFRAQYIFVIPEHDMVVIVNGDTRSGIDQRKPIGFLYTHILKSVQR